MTLAAHNPSPSPKILLIGPSFSGGGAEGRFTTIAKYLFGGKTDVAVLVAKKNNTDLTVGKFIDLKWKGRLSYPKLIWQLSKQIKKQRYDTIMAFGFFPIIISILALLFARCNTKIIINEITRPKMAGGSGRNKVYNILRRLLYRRSTVVTANSIDGLRETCELAGRPYREGIRVVNVIDTNRLKRKAKEKTGVQIPKGRFVICVARLEFMKRIDTVIDALALLTERIDCQLIIVGDGIAKTTLETQVVRAGLQNRVLFTGTVNNPFPLLIHASALVLASEYEGFSNSVLEAMFCDIPVITSLCSSDAQEMCKQGAALGFEIGDSKRLSEHLHTILTDNKLHQNLIQCAQNYRTPHALEQAIPFYEELFYEVAG